MQAGAKVLVVGAHGFLGQATARQLIQRGFQVRALDVLPPPPTFTGESVEARFDDARAVQKALAGCHYVLHLAHAKFPSVVDRSLQRDLQENLQPLLLFYELCAEANVERVVYVSSGGTVYGETSAARISEDHPTLPLSPYGTLKLCAESYARLFTIQRHLPCVIARPANAFGPGQRPFMGQGIVATALASGILKQKIELFSEPASERDYVHVDDIASAFCELLAHGKSGEAYNIGSGVGTTLETLLEEHIRPTLARHGFQLDLRWLPPRSLDVKRNVLAIEKIMRDTPWRPRHTLSSSLGSTLEWLQKFLAQSQRIAQ